MKTFIKVVLISIILTLPAQATTLGTVNIQNHNNDLSDQGTVYGGGLNGLNGYTGVYSWTNAGGTGLGAFVPNWGFCIELPQGSYTGWYDVIPLDEAPLPSQYGTPMGTAKADYIRELWSKHFDPAWITGANAQMAEAFSACIWEIVYETDPTWNVTSGTGFYATGIEQAAAANSWLAGLNGTGPLTYLYAISTLEGQDYVVPEPATICLLAIGAIAILRKK